MRKPRYTDSVFINCPFDVQYMPLFRAIIFSIYQCGFFPRSALEEDNALDNRLDKIVRLVNGCKLGIHDISRTELNVQGHPRFNMPFELGLFFGAKKLGDEKQKSKNALIFERVAYAYREFLSDLSGVDTKAHNNQAEQVVRLVREWLSTVSRRKTIPTLPKLRNAFLEFENKLPVIAADIGYAIDEIPFNDFCRIVEKAIAQKVQ
jgi:hypothetical protein